MICQLTDHRVNLFLNEISPLPVRISNSTTTSQTEYIITNYPNKGPKSCINKKPGANPGLSDYFYVQKLKRRYLIVYINELAEDQVIPCFAGCFARSGY